MQRFFTWFTFTTLRKKLWRSDRIWVSKLIYRDPLKRIPILLDTAILMRSQYWPRQRIEDLVDMRLRDILARTATLPFWKARYQIARTDPMAFTRSDLLRLPPLTKEDFFSRDISEYTNAALRAKSHTDSTSGSTGKPLNFLLDWRAELRYCAIRDRMFQAAGEQFPVIYLRGRSNPGLFFGRHILFFLRGYNQIKNRVPELLKLIGKFPQGFILYGYSSSMVELSRRVLESKEHFPVRAIFATGEGMRDSDRAFIEKALHTKMFLTYATWEVKWIAHECTHHRYHINEEYVYVEIVDQEGKPLPHGREGDILVTSFESEAMPYIRYAVGDRGRINTEPCPCGKTLNTLEFSGRVSDMISLPGGRVVPLFDLIVTFDLFQDAVRQFRVIQKGPAEFTLMVIPGPRFEEMKKHLQEALMRLLHPTVNITWLPVSEIPQAASGKAAYFVREF